MSERVGMAGEFEGGLARLARLSCAISAAIVGSADPRRQIREALGAMTRLTCAKVVACTSVRIGARGPEFVDVIEGGEWPPDARQSYMDYLSDEAAGDPFLAAMFGRVMRSPGRIVSLRRSDAVDDATWYGSRHYTRYRGAVGFDDCVYTAVFWPAEGTGEVDAGAGGAGGAGGGVDGVRVEGMEAIPGMMVGLGLHALAGAGRFSAEDRVLATAGLAGVSPVLAGLLRGERMGAANLFARLTPRQREVVILLNEGISTKEIGRRLSLREGSVHTYVQAACRRLGVRGQIEAVALCNRHGWINGVSRPGGADGADGVGG
jgi:DNA-binding CsgD family transcriptional regulator